MRVGSGYGRARIAPTVPCSALRACARPAFPRRRARRRPRSCSAAALLVDATNPYVPCGLRASLRAAGLRAPWGRPSIDGVRTARPSLPSLRRATNRRDTGWNSLAVYDERTVQLSPGCVVGNGRATDRSTSTSSRIPGDGASPFVSLPHRTTHRAGDMPAAPARGIRAVTDVSVFGGWLGGVIALERLAANAALARRTGALFGLGPELGTALARVDGRTDSTLIGSGSPPSRGLVSLRCLRATAVMLNCTPCLNARRIRGLRTPLACRAAAFLELRHERAHCAEVDLYE